MVEQLHSFYLDKEEPNKSCLLALRDIILNQDTAIAETRKWGMPCFCYVSIRLSPCMTREFCFLLLLFTLKEIRNGKK
ncbi:MAG: DUF1801 domain-containing protein [Sphingobacterium sp.]